MSLNRVFTTGAAEVVFGETYAILCRKQTKTTSPYILPSIMQFLVKLTFIHPCVFMSPCICGSLSIYL